MPGQGVFENGGTSGVQYANFDGSYQAINGLDYQQAANSYTVQSGDTLQSISQAVYGDSSVKSLSNVTPVSRPIMTPLGEVRASPQRDPRAQRSPKGIAQRSARGWLWTGWSGRFFRRDF